MGRLTARLKEQINPSVIRIFWSTENVDEKYTRTMRTRIRKMNHNVVAMEGRLVLVSQLWLVGFSKLNKGLLFVTKGLPARILFSQRPWILATIRQFGFLRICGLQLLDAFPFCRTPSVFDASTLRTRPSALNSKFWIVSIRCGPWDFWNRPNWWFLLAEFWCPLLPSLSLFHIHVSSMMVWLLSIWEHHLILFLFQKWWSEMAEASPKAESR